METFLERITRKMILDRVREHYNLKPPEKFVPGETYIRYGGRVYDENEMVSLVDSALDFWLTEGRYSERFEQDLAEYLGMRHCILTNSGSSANLLAISALTSPQLGEDRLHRGDEVILTACGFPTTLNPIIQNNLSPVFVDVDLGTYVMKTNDLEGAISDKTGAIFVSHTLGNPVDMDKILEIAEDNVLWVIEDNCDSLGSKYHGTYTGAFGHISTCSFYPPHHITMGEGGAVLTDDKKLQKIIRSFRDWGRDCWCKTGEDNSCGHRFTRTYDKLPYGYDHKYVYSHVGYNLKVTDMQAAIGVEQLKKLSGFTSVRRRNFDLLYAGLEKHSWCFNLPYATPGSEPSWFGFPIMVKKTVEFTRNDIVQYLENRKVATRMLFAGNLTKQPAYDGLDYRIYGTLENTDRVMNDLFWIGVYPGITVEMMVYILQVFDDFFNGDMHAAHHCNSDV